MTYTNGIHFVVVIKLKRKRKDMNSNYIPSDIKCFWCNGHMRERGITKMGAGINDITYFCIDCGGIAHFAIDTDRNSKIKSFEIKYNRSKDE